MSRTILYTFVLSFSIFFATGAAHASRPAPKFQLSVTHTLATTAIAGMLGGAAVVVPIQEGSFVRFFGAGGVLNPIGTELAIPTARTAFVIGCTPANRFNLVAGAGLAMIFLPDGPQLSPIGIIGVNLWLVPGKISVAFPTVVTTKGIVWNLEIAFTLPPFKK